jgi:hypothetical protein
MQGVNVEECGLLGFNNVQLGKNPKLRVNIPPLTSGLWIKPRRKLACSCPLLPASILLGLLFDCKNCSGIFLRNVRLFRPT